jgi:hypothetical protein
VWVLALASEFLELHGSRCDPRISSQLAYVAGWVFEEVNHG